MNEELKIIIKAITDDAKKNIDKVKKEFEKVEAAGEKAKKTIDKAFTAIAKGAAVAVGAIVAVTTALVTLGKKSLEFQQQQAKLNAAFAAVGSNGQQAAKTYKDLFRFLGDSDRATETAQLLSKITTEEEKLAEWTKTLQGIYSAFGNAIPVESLAEAANETIKVGKVTGTMADALSWLGVSEDEFNAKLANTVSLEEREALVRSTLNNLYSGAADAYEKANGALLAYNESQLKVDQALADAAKYTVPLMTELNELAAILLQVLKPAFETISAVIIVFVQWIVAAIEFIGSFFGIFGEEGVKATEAVKNNIGAIQGSAAGVGKAVKGATKEIEKLKKQTMGFDELNVVSSPTTSTSGAGADGGAGVAGGLNIPSIESADIGSGWLEDFQTNVDKIKEKMEGIAVLVGAIVAGFGLWKLADFITEITSAKNLIKIAGEEGALAYQKAFGKEAQNYIDNITNKAKLLGGIMLIVAGAILLVQGYSDAWVNGLDWGNFLTILAGIGLIVGGMALAFSPLAAAIATIIGGITLIVIGIKDFITNGYSMESVISIAVGAILVLVGAIWAFNAALLANPITWVVAAIIALVAIFVILWNECDAFREFWLKLWDKAKQLFAKFVDSIKPLIDAIVEAFKKAWELIKVVWNDYLVPLFKKAWEAIKFVWDAVKPYFENIWGGIKLVFSVVVEILGGYFKAAWEVIKGVWSVVVDYFTMIFKNIALVFSAVKDVLGGNFSSAWEKIKQIFSNVGSFFTNVWNTIKNVFANVGKIVAETISNVVKKAINSVLSSAVKLINGFISAINVAISVINAIPGVNISKLDKLEVPKFAKGGVVNSATLGIFGEAGREAVLPLENNTEWMDTLADRIAARNSTPTRIALVLDGNELGWANIKSINNITRQTGSLQLTLA